MELRSLMLCEYLKGTQFDSGQQKNGDYFCWQCPLFAPLSPSIVHAMSLPHLSLSDRISKVRSTQASVSKLKRNLVKLYSNLKKDEVVQELHERKVSFTCKSSAKDLRNFLSKKCVEFKSYLQFSFRIRQIT